MEKMVGSKKITMAGDGERSAQLAKPDSDVTRVIIIKKSSGNCHSNANQLNKKYENNGIF